MEARAADALTSHSYGTRGAFGPPVDEAIGAAPPDHLTLPPQTLAHSDSTERWPGG